MQYVIAFLFLILGYFIGSFGVIQMLTVIRFSIPYTKELNHQNLLNDSKLITKRNLSTIFTWSIILVLLTLLTYCFASNLNLIAYLAGMVITILLGYGSTGYTETHIEEYVCNYHKYFIYNQYFDINNKEDIISTLLMAENIKTMVKTTKKY